MPTLEITTMVGCPMRCTYCPQDALKGAYGKAAKYLSVDDFKTVLAKVPRYVRIDFSGMAEPWANPDTTEMLRHALASGFNVAVYTTLYGMKDPGQVVALLKAHAEQVEAVVLHLPDRDGNMRGYKRSAAHAAALDAFLALRAEGVLRKFTAMTMDREGRVHRSVAKQIGKLGEWRGLTRAGNLEVEGDHPIEGTPLHDTPVGCSFTPFYDHNVLLPNGDVVVCCMDYAMKHRLGNLLTDGYFDLFASAGMRELAVENMRHGHSTGSICKSCVRAQRYEVYPGQRQFWNAL